ncbi:MAG TPA: carboxypeptidase regulatory-like domain-containing protein [Pyrinomonadaceae bacterium]|nr:carboxypeptidase regulatory-like domain-containing protein [Pyrinomonadaceae bacterium]
MRNSFSVFSRRAAGVIILTLGLAVAAQAQFRAALQGVVTDPQGGAVVGATVTLTSKENNQTQQVTSSDEGFYRFDRLAPGAYILTAEMSGFKKQVLENVEVKAEEVQGVNVALEAGEISETVTISSIVGETLQTENANVGGSISEREIQRLPQTGRDPYELVRLTPGVFGLGSRNATGGSQGLPGQVGPGGSNSQIFQTENQVPVSAAGQRPEANNFQIDGVNAMSQAWGGAAVVTPNQESVKEVRVVANNYSAEFGRNSGAQVLIVSQTGTNDFHGSLFFKRNTPGMNAFQDFDRAGTAIREDPQRVNQFLSQYGGSIGGPILKNRLFGFFSYETVRSSSSRIEGLWVETPQFVNTVNAARPGSIANTVLGFPGMTPPRIVATQNLTCAQYGITNSARCQQVAGGLDVGSPTGAIGQFVPDNVGGGLDGIPDVQFASIELPSSNTSEQFNVRVDYQVTKNDLVAFSTYFVPSDTLSNDAWGNRGRPGLDFVSGRRNMVGTLLWTRTLSATMVNEARFNVTRWYFDEAATNPDVGYGIPMLRIFGEQFISFGQHTGPGVFYQNTYNFRDVLSKVSGAHALKFGADVIKEQNNDKAPWAGRPTFEFNNLWSFANDAPQVESAFYDPATGDFTDLAAYPRSTYIGLFAQDDWKIRPNISLNLGLRWDYYSPLRSKRDRISNLILGPDGGLIGSTIQTGGDLYNSDKNNFGPQIGVAWSPKTIFGQNVENRMVIRGGFGIGYNRLPGSRLLESRFNPPFFASFFFDRASGNIVYRTAADLNSFDYPPNPNATLTFDPNSGLPIGPSVGFNAVDQDVRNPIIYRFSADAEYEMGKGFIVSLGFQGSRGRSLPRPVPYNLLVPDSPNFGGVTLLLTDARSNFNAMLVEARRRFSNNFQFAAEYRLASSKDTCSSDHDCRATYPFDQETEYGPSSYDVKHAFKAYGVWALPFFRNRNDWKGKVLGGFELSGIVTASSGFPWTPVVGGSQCGAVVSGGQGVCPLRPIAQIMGPANDSTSNDTFLGAGQFPGGGLLYFTPPPTGSFNTPPPPGIGRNSFRGPNYFSVDTTVVKRFGLPLFPVLGENAGIEIRFNVYNLFNRTNLSPFGINDDNTQIQHPDFGRALHVLSGRVTEIQARFNF